VAVVVAVAVAAAAAAAACREVDEGVCSRRYSRTEDVSNFDA
jgi:hypothetical protein